MTALSPAVVEETVSPVASKRRRDLTAYWLIAPGVLWMALFLVVPILMIIYVSFWTQTTFKKRILSVMWADRAPESATVRGSGGDRTVPERLVE